MSQRERTSKFCLPSKLAHISTILQKYKKGRDWKTMLNYMYVKPKSYSNRKLVWRKKTLVIFSPVGCPQIYLSCSNFQRIALTNWCFYQIGCFPRQANLEKSIGRWKSYNSYIRELRNWGGTKEATILMWKEFLSFLFTFWRGFIFAQILSQNLAGISAEIAIDSCFHILEKNNIYIGLANFLPISAEDKVRLRLDKLG